MADSLQVAESHHLVDVLRAAGAWSGQARYEMTGRSAHSRLSHARTAISKIDQTASQRVNQVMDVNNIPCSCVMQPARREADTQVMTPALLAVRCVALKGLRCHSS